MRWSLLLLLAFAFPAHAGDFDDNEEPEVLHIGDEGPDFSLPDNHGYLQTLRSYRGRIVVLEWTNLDCPASAKHYSSKHIQKDQKWATEKDIVWISISSPEDANQAPTLTEINDRMAELKSSASALVMDHDGTVAKAYQVHRTPEFVILDAEGKIVYRGAADDKPGNKKTDLDEAEDYVRGALQSLLKGKKPDPAKTTPYGCPLFKQPEEKGSGWLLQ